MTRGQEWAERVLSEIKKAVIGQETIIERLLIGLLTGGHVLIEGMPGLAKTLLVKTIAKAVGLKFERIQFTPDLLPSDVVGTMIFQPKEGRFFPHLGPIFANIVLADEINRAPAKVQSALLEAMQEKQVTIGGTSHKLPDPFVVMATQNPIEQEGTYPLPEAQSDRFLFKVIINYPSEEEERKMLKLWGKLTEEPLVSPVSSPEEIRELRKQIDKIFVSPITECYILALVRETRELAGIQAGGMQKLSYGASPRASLALFQASRALAWIRGSDFLSPQFIQEVYMDCLRHRVGLSYESEAEGKTVEDILGEILKNTSIPTENVEECS
ncbi:MoxR family ATPase [Candidatus Methylacidiphilum infernorum]|uniref:MoxR family ATPase n=1 Tax=Candidatus Methylacidiphilum infernorum TaxID=511746 RepID=A0ABX7PWU1_9BACT|nr:MoxR family ATPase [Candidatus Methylacidiphilum infernorum]QSR87054.1 MoxR family ATPase [Candidatus Methylacidiphilum infernorum]